MEDRVLRGGGSTSIFTFISLDAARRRAPPDTKFVILNDYVGCGSSAAAGGIPRRATLAAPEGAGAGAAAGRPERPGMGEAGRDAGAGPSTSGRMLAAGGAAVTAALVTTPLDVVKNRLQGQLEAGLGLPAAGPAAAAPPSAAGEAASCSSLRPASQAAYSRFKTVGGAAARVGRGGIPAGLQQYSFNTQTCPSTCPTVAAPGTVPRCGAGECQHTYRGPLDAIRKISRYNGVLAFWRGLDATLSLSVPTVGIYLPMYDWILGQLQARMELGAGAPVAAGMVARTIAVGVTNPLEIVRTRMQALPGSTSFRGELRSLLFDPRTQRVNRVGEIWRGTGITLLRDVPFSGLYWGLTEALKAELAEGLAWTEPGPAQVRPLSPHPHPKPSPAGGRC